MSTARKITIVFDEDQYGLLVDALLDMIRDGEDLDHVNDLSKMRDHVIRRTRSRRSALGYDPAFEPQLDHCPRCAHRYGTGCGDRCCARRKEIAP